MKEKKEKEKEKKDKAIVNILFVFVFHGRLDFDEIEKLIKKRDEDIKEIRIFVL
jgi:hypothetical protein